MIHLARAAGARPNSGQFAVAPEGAIEQNDIGFVNGIPQFIGQFTDTRRKQRSRSRRIVPKLKRGAPWQFNRSKRDGATQRLKFSGRLSPFDSAEFRKDAFEPPER